MLKDTKQIGDISLSMVLSALLRSNKKILLPFGEGYRYDLVIDDDNVFKRVQCKTGRLVNGVVKFNMYSVVRDAATNKYVHKPYTDNEIDVYGIYCPQTHETYLISCKEFSGTTEARLRVDPSESKKPYLGKFAKDYRI